MSWIARQLGRLLKPRRTVATKPIRAGYDAATYDLTNERHWLAADSYSPNAQLDSSTRQLLRDRSRYEAANNGYYGGVIETIAGDVVGSGPRPQVRIPGDEGRRLGRLFENWWKQWAAASAFAEDLTVLQEACVRDGESFAVMVSNPGLVADGRTLVALDLAVYEAEQVADPWDYGLNALYTDGVLVDEFSNPVEYTFLKNHPGGVSVYRGWDTEKLPAWQVCHWYKRKRAGQTRGVPWMVAALPMFAQMRRYTLATLSAAEVAANLAGIMQTDASADAGGAPTIEAMDTVQLARGALLTLPAGWSASQFKPEQPVTSYGQFKTEILNEVGRGANVPLNIVSGNSSGYNYSSARLDRQLYFSAVRRERERMAARFLDRIFHRWAKEAAMVYGVQVPPVEDWSWTWFWDGVVSIDPQKDAAADAANLENGTTTLAEICAERGLDWEEVIRQRAAEKKLIEDLGAGPEEPPADGPAETPPEEPPPAPLVANGFIEIEAARVFDESKVKRAPDGKFGSGGASGAAPKKSTAPKKAAAKKPAAKKPSAKKMAAVKPAPKKTAAKKKTAEPTADAPAAEAPKKVAPAKKASPKKKAEAKPDGEAAPAPKKAPAKKAATPKKAPARKADPKSADDPKPKPAETPVQKPDISSHSDDELRQEYERRFGKPATPAAPKKAAAKKAAPAALPEKHHALRDDTKALIERLSTDARNVPDAEIETALSRIEKAGMSDAEVKQMAFEVAGVREKTRKKAMLAMRGKLTAAKRILEGRKS